jgi:hypothetical protein
VSNNLNKNKYHLGHKSGISRRKVVRRIMILKDKYTKKVFVFTIAFVLLLELLFAYKLIAEYRGIYQLGWAITPFLFQIYFFIMQLKKDLIHFKYRLVIIAFTTVCFSIVILFTLPSYTYNEGKQLVKQTLPLGSNTEFIDMPKNRDIVPLADDFRKLLIHNRAYYYRIKSAEGDKFFMVNPITGKIDRLSEDFYKVYDFK